MSIINNSIRDAIAWKLWVTHKEYDKANADINNEYIKAIAGEITSLNWICELLEITDVVKKIGVDLDDLNSIKEHVIVNTCINCQKQPKVDDLEECPDSLTSYWDEDLGNMVAIIDPLPKTVLVIDDDIPEEVEVNNHEILTDDPRYI